MFVSPDVNITFFGLKMIENISVIFAPLVTYSYAPHELHQSIADELDNQYLKLNSSKKL